MSLSNPEPCGGVGTIRKCFGEKKKKEMLFSLLTLVSKKWFRKQTVELNHHLVSQHADFALLLNITKRKITLTDAKTS